MEIEFITRKARMSDVSKLLELINGYAGKGIMLPRTEFEMAENLRDFVVVFAGAELAGCGALHFYTPQTAEIRSLGVDPKWKGHGIGRLLMNALEAEARDFGLDSVFAFTYIPNFFQKSGFIEIERGELPLKAWKDCLRCPKFQCCDEIAVIKPLSASEMGVMNTRIRGERVSTRTSPSTDLVMPYANRGR